MTASNAISLQVLSSRSQNLHLRWVKSFYFCFVGGKLSMWMSADSVSKVSESVSACVIWGRVCFWGAKSENYD